VGADGDRRSRDRLKQLFDLLVCEGSDASPPCPAIADVPALMTLATRHRVSWALARQLLDERARGLDEAALAAARDTEREWVSWRRTLRAQLGELFGAAVVPLMHVKGFAAEAWNGGRYLRDSGDVDLVVPDLPSAVALLDRLLDLDYRLDETCWMHLTPRGQLEGPVIMVSRRPDEIEERCVEVNIGGFPPASFTPSLPLAVADGVDIDVDGTLVRVTNRLQTLVVLCGETMHRELMLRDAIDLVLIVEDGGPAATIPPLEAAAREAGVDWALDRLARFALSLLPDRPSQLGRRSWLRRLTRRRAPLGSWRTVAATLGATWGWRRGAELTARYLHYRAESWLFERDRALRLMQRVNRWRDPLAVLAGSGAPVFTVPLHTGRTERLRAVPEVRRVAEDPGGLWWGARYRGAPLLVLPIGVYLLSVDCVLEPADIARLRGDMGRLAG